MLVKRQNLKIIFIILTIISLIIATTINNYFIPAEDALILFRYAENLSQSGVISYNLNFEKVEGATDFLWMIILSGFNLIGLDIFFTAILINLISLSLISIILVKEFNLNKYFAYLIFIFHFFLGFSWSSMFGFSVLTMELILIIFLICYQKNKTFLLITTGFIGTLLRPDFILFVFIISIFHFFEKISYKKLFIYILFFLFGLSYFYWRYQYFGLIFPLPYYVKSQWQFINNLSWYREIIILSPFILLLFKYIKFNQIFSKKNIIIILSTIILPTLYYSNQILYQNLGNRFYFYFIPVSLFLIFNLVSKNKNFEKFFILLIFLSSSISLFINISEKNTYPFSLLFNERSNFVQNTKQSVRFILPNLLKSEIDTIKIATTEAGSIPYYSKLFSIDLFGLNDKQLSKKPAGGKYLIKNKFDLIIISSGQQGTNCIGLKKFYKLSRTYVPKFQIDRESNWNEFTMQLMSGIDQKKFDVFLIPLYSIKDDNVFFFLEKNSKEFIKLKKIISKFGSLCALE